MMMLSEAAAALGVQHTGTDVQFSSVGSDSRNIVAGQLFVALKGANFDGNTFAQEALKLGAVAVLVSDTAVQAEPRIVVADTRQQGAGEEA